jgi:hypothetical protein
MIHKKFNSLLYGLVPGLVLPILFFLAFWMLKSDSSLQQFLVDFQRLGMLSKVLSLSAIPNLLLFFLFIWTDRNFSARGVVFSTLILAFVMLILKFV